MTSTLLKALTIATLLAASSAALADQSIQVQVVNGKQQAAFEVGDAKCVLVNDTIQCTRLVLAAN
jgi:hypothetical protein